MTCAAGPQVAHRYLVSAGMWDCPRARDSSQTRLPGLLGNEDVFLASEGQAPSAKGLLLTRSLPLSRAVLPAFLAGNKEESYTLYPGEHGLSCWLCGPQACSRGLSMTAQTHSGRASWQVSYLRRPEEGRCVSCGRLMPPSLTTG